MSEHESEHLTGDPRPEEKIAERGTACIEL